MVTLISFAVAAVILVGVFGAGWFFGLRTRSRRFKGAPDSKRRPAGQKTSVIAQYDDNMEIPAALVGARCKEIIEHFAPILGTTPVNLLRGALAEGLTGGRPVTEEMIDILEEMVKTGEIAPPSSKPPPLN